MRVTVLLPSRMNWKEIKLGVLSTPWGQNVKLIKAVKDPAERMWYARQAVGHGWSLNVLIHQIKCGLVSRQGKAITNFARTLPMPQSDLAQRITGVEMIAAAVGN